MRGQKFFSAGVRRNLTFLHGVGNQILGKTGRKEVVGQRFPSLGKGAAHQFLPEPIAGEAPTAFDPQKDQRGIYLGRRIKGARGNPEKRTQGSHQFQRNSQRIPLFCAGRGYEPVGGFLLDHQYNELQVGGSQFFKDLPDQRRGDVVGDIVTEGRITKDSIVRITRDKEQIYEGPIATLKHFKDDVKEVKGGSECGMVFENFGQIQEGDLVEAHIMVEVPR